MWNPKLSQYRTMSEGVMKATVGKQLMVRNASMEEQRKRVWVGGQALPDMTKTQLLI